MDKQEPIERESVVNAANAATGDRPRRSRRRGRFAFWAGALAFVGVASTLAVAHAWIAAVQPAAVVAVPASVVPGNPTAPDIIVFDELQDVILPVPLLLDVQPVNPSVQLPAELNPVWLPAGTCVSSHYADYEDTMVSTATGGVRFVRPILGVALRQVTLDASNFLGRPGVTYPTAANCNAVPGVDCGMELLPQDQLRVDVNRVQMQFTAESPGDRIRVLTRGEPGKCHPIGQPGPGEG